MVARSEKIDTPRNWQQQVADTITDPAQLFEHLHLPSSQLEAARDANKLFSLKLPRQLLSKISSGNMDDPLLRQFLPVGAETQANTDYRLDPLAEKNAQVAPGLLHKYHGRVLLITTAACAVHCRYCFRRHYPYTDNRGQQDDWRGAFEYISARPEISEVILSGGDPLSLSDRRLTQVVARLEAIHHLTTLRLHSRTAALIPERLTPALLKLLGDSRFNVVMVLHVNHPDELDDASQQALQKLRQVGVTLLNQSVLLAGVNDASDTLVALSRKLIECSILPYYLHLPDPVQGTAHFMVDQQRGKQLIAEMQAQLPGYLVPRLVKEIAHQTSKTTVA